MIQNGEIEGLNERISDKSRRNNHRFCAWISSWDQTWFLMPLLKKENMFKEEEMQEEMLEEIEIDTLR